MECYKDRISYYVSWVNIDYTTENGLNDTGEHMYNITGLVANGNYTISVWAVVDRNVRIRSGVVSEKVTVGQPQVLPENSTQPVCYNRMFNLVCEVPSQYIGNYSNIYWILDSHNISGFAMYRTSSDGTHLFVLNVTRNTTGDYECHIELSDGTLVEGEAYDMEPLDSPKRPHNIALTQGADSINVSWEHDNSCFENYVFEFIVTWRKADTRNNFEYKTVNGTTFNIPNLEPNANYKICILAVSISNEQVKSEQECKTTSATPSTGGVSIIAIIVPIAAVAVLVLILTVVVISIVVWRHIQNNH